MSTGRIVSEQSLRHIRETRLDDRKVLVSLEAYALESEESSRCVKKPLRDAERIPGSKIISFLEQNDANISQNSTGATSTELTGSFAEALPLLLSAL